MLAHILCLVAAGVAAVAAQSRVPIFKPQTCGLFADTMNESVQWLNIKVTTLAYQSTHCNLIFHFEDSSSFLWSVHTDYKSSYIFSEDLLVPAFASSNAYLEKFWATSPVYSRAGNELLHDKKITRKSLIFTKIDGRPLEITSKDGKLRANFTVSDNEKEFRLDNENFYIQLLVDENLVFPQLKISEDLNGKAVEDGLLINLIKTLFAKTKKVAIESQQVDSLKLSVPADNLSVKVNLWALSSGFSVESFEIKNMPVRKQLFTEPSFSEICEIPSNVCQKTLNDDKKADNLSMFYNPLSQKVIATQKLGENYGRNMITTSQFFLVIHNNSLKVTNRCTGVDLTIESGRVSITMSDNRESWIYDHLVESDC